MGNGEKEWLLSDMYLNYLESLPAEDREITLNIHIKHFGLDMDSFELFAVLKNRDMDTLIGKLE